MLCAALQSHVGAQGVTYVHLGASQVCTAESRSPLVGKGSGSQHKEWGRGQSWGPSTLCPSPAGRRLAHAACRSTETMCAEQPADVGLGQEVT